MGLAQGRPIAADGSWKPAGPTGGYVWELAVSPDFQTDGTIFASTDDVGVYRSTDRGGTWHNVSRGIGHRSVRALAVSPAYGTDSTVFAGGPDGVYKSVDGGVTWQHSISGLDNPRVLALAVSPGFAADSTILAGVSDGLYRSTDGGSSWRRATEGLTGATVVSIEFSPGFERDSTVFAGMLGERVISYLWGALLYVTPPGGVFRSTDGGVTWEIYEDLKKVSAMSVSLSPSFEFDSTAFVGTLHSGIFRTTDGGGDWEQVAEGLPFQQVHVGRGLAQLPIRLHSVRRDSWDGISHDRRRWKLGAGKRREALLERSCGGRWPSRRLSGATALSSQGPALVVCCVRPTQGAPGSRYTGRLPSGT